MVQVKGNKVLDGDKERKRCCRDDDGETGVRDLAKVSPNILSDQQDVGETVEDRMWERQQMFEPG